LTGRNAQLIYAWFRLLDVHDTGAMDDVQFTVFLSMTTDLSQKQILKVFDIFDLDRSGSCEFDEVRWCGTSISATIVRLSQEAKY
jgi:Ca2+-binding EF-hand superfamily protein